MKSSKILVTGGCGAIGSNLVKSLKNSSDIIVIDNLSSGDPALLPADVELYKNDIRDTEVLEKIFTQNKIAVVYHLAANFANQNSVDNPVLDLEVNGIGTLNVLKCAQKYGTEKFVYTSSSCVYGSNLAEMTEDKTGNLDTPYAISKLVGEQYCNYFHEHFKLPVVNVRLFNSYGPGELWGRYRNVIPNFFHCALNKQPLNITGTGNETRDFTFVQDTVNGLIKVAQTEKCVGRTYNFGTGRETAVIDIATVINRLCGNEGNIKYLPKRPWDSVDRRRAVTVRAAEDIGWNPQTRLEEGLQIYYEWLINRRK